MYLVGFISVYEEGWKEMLLVEVGEWSLDFLMIFVLDFFFCE